MLVEEGVGRVERRLMRVVGERCRLRLRWRGEGLCLGGGRRLLIVLAMVQILHSPGQSFRKKGIRVKCIPICENGLGPVGSM